MSAPCTVVAIDANGTNTLLLKKVISSQPDRIPVIVDSPALAMHALSTMVVSLFICNYALGEEQIKHLLTVAVTLSPSIRTIIVGPAVAENISRSMLDKLSVKGEFLPLPYNPFKLQNAIKTQIAGYLQDASSSAVQTPPSLIRSKNQKDAITEPVERHQGPDPNMYSITGVLGNGGAGTVFSAVDKFLGIELAIKVINPKLLTSPESLVAFKNEARITMQLSHRNILRLYGFHAYLGSYYIVMELVRGKSLRDLLLENNTLFTTTVCSILIQCASALSYAHDYNVIHKDLKLENIFVTEAGEVKIIDFGSATLNASKNSEAGEIVGTPEYMAPEQLRGEVVGPEADIYAMAVLTYILFLGCFPFPDGTTADMLLSGVRPDFSALPDELAAVLDKATAYYVEDRYHSIKDFVRDIVTVCGCAAMLDNPRAPVEIVPGPQLQEPSTQTLRRVSTFRKIPT